VELGVPRDGAEVDETVLPAETGLVERTVSFSKGCYVGQEPVARLHYRGHPNRLLRRLLLRGPDAPALPAEVVAGGRTVGRVTSVAALGSGARGLAYVRREVADGSDVEVLDAAGRSLLATVEPLA
jgi:folate-binding protein YgfZ